MNDRRLLQTKLFLRPDEVAQILRVSKRTVYRLIEDGELQAKKIRGSLRIYSASLKSFLEDEETLSQSAFH